MLAWAQFGLLALLACIEFGVFLKVDSRIGKLVATVGFPLGSSPAGWTKKCCLPSQPTTTRHRSSVDAELACLVARIFATFCKFVTKFHIALLCGGSPRAGKVLVFIQIYSMAGQTRLMR